MEEKNIEDYLDQLEGGWLSDDGLDDKNSDDEYRDADEIIRVLQTENDDDDLVDEIADTDPPLVEDDYKEHQEPSHSSTSTLMLTSSFSFDKRKIIWKKSNMVHDKRNLLSWEVLLLHMRYHNWKPHIVFHPLHHK